MSKETFEELATDVREAIEEDINTTVTITTVRDTFDETESEVSTGGETPYTGVIVSPLVPFEIQFVDGSTVLDGDTMCVVPAQNKPFTSLLPGDRLTEGTDEWLMESVNEIKRVDAAGNKTIVSWELHLRGVPDV